MSFEDLKKRISKCNRCGKNRFWHFPTCKGVKGFFGDKEYIFVCPQPHEGIFDPFNIRLDRRLYDNLAKHGFEDAHLTDMVKCRGAKYKELTDVEVRNCVGWLKEEIQIVQPQAIIAMGTKSFDALNKYRFQPVLMVTHYSNYYVSDEDYEAEFKALRSYLDSGNIKHSMKMGRLITPEQRQKQEEKQAFGELITLLNKLKSSGKITATQWRNHRDQWKESPHDRETLVQHLRFLLKNNA